MKNVFWGFLLFLLVPLSARAELNLETPERLLVRAGAGKNQLRDVINELDQNLTEMRDVETFDRYFSLLNQLQEISDRVQLDTIYPDGVKKLGSRMVQKGVNWLDIIESPKEKILYYHRWMKEPQPAFSFLYATELRIKEEKQIGRLKIAAINLEATLLYADQKWPNERALRLLYRSAISDIAAKALKDERLDEAEILFWFSKIYSAEAAAEIVTYLQTIVFDLKPGTKTHAHWIAGRLTTLHMQVASPAFGAPDSLLSQIGDATVDLIMKTFRFQEKLSDSEFQSLLSTLRLRHLAALANAWASFGKVNFTRDFAGYFIQRAFAFIQLLEHSNLSQEATQLSTVITKKAAVILARQHDLEGTWTMKDAKGKVWRLVIIQATEDLLFASLTDEHNFTNRPFFHVVYDMIQGGFIATERVADTDRSPNLPIRFMPQDDGTIEVTDLLMGASAEPMQATKTQKFPDILSQGAPNGPDLNGVYEGTLVIPGGGKTKATLVVTVFNGYSLGNLRFLIGGSNTTLNYGSDALTGVVYLTRGNNTMMGTWMHLRARLVDGALRGFAIYGNSGMVAEEFVFKKVK